MTKDTGNDSSNNSSSHSSSSNNNSNSSSSSTSTIPPLSTSSSSCNVSPSALYTQESPLKDFGVSADLSCLDRRYSSAASDTAAESNGQSPVGVEVDEDENHHQQMHQRQQQQQQQQQQQHRGRGGTVDDSIIMDKNKECCIRRHPKGKQKEEEEEEEEEKDLPIHLNTNKEGEKIPLSPTNKYNKLNKEEIINKKEEIINKKDKKDICCLPSKLDFFDPNSEIAKSPYRGFATLLFICSAFYLVANPIMRWYERGEYFDKSLAVGMFYDFFFLMFMWFKLTVWSLTAYGLHLLFMKGYIGRKTLFVLQHLTQFTSIAYAVGHCLYNRWPIIPAAFVQVAAVCNFMKMHSYTEINLEFYYKKDTEDACKYYPDNVNLRNFCYYMVVPSLVYEPHFPRGKGFRPSYFLWKLISLASAMTVMYLACTSYLIPTISRSPQVSLMEAIFSLIFPFLFLDLLIFFILFECICNLLAEVTNFGNRDFYHDWWNSTNWDEYSRKWNRPVHKFLLRHVYMETQQKYRWSQRSAAVATFLFSALLHEMIMSCYIGKKEGKQHKYLFLLLLLLLVSFLLLLLLLLLLLQAVCLRFVRFYLFALMLFQIPLVALGRYYAHNRCLGNAIFWACMLLGVPLLAVAYGREFAQHFYTESGGWQTLPPCSRVESTNI